VKLAQAAGWEVAVTATPEALAFIDAPLLEVITGFPVRHRDRGHAASARVADAAYLFPFLLTGSRARLALGQSTPPSAGWASWPAP
jgi:hypothetical protein